MTKREMIFKICVGAFLVFLVALLLFVFAGDDGSLIKYLLSGDFSGTEMQDKLRDIGLRGYLTVSVLSMLQVLFTVLPAEPIQLLAGLTFGFPVGLLSCWAGVFLGNSVIFLLQKIYGNKLRRFFVRKFHLDLEKIANSGKSTVVVLILYFMPAVPYGMIAFFASSLGIRYWRYIILTLLGALPSVCIGVGLGHMAITSHWVVSLCVFAVLIALLVVITIYRERMFAKINALADKPKYSSKTQVGKCNPLLLAVLFTSLRFYYFLRGLRIKKVNRCGHQPEAPSIVLCNHGSFIDFLYAGALLQKSRPHFIVARLYFYHRLLGSMLKGLGCFPKSMFAVDIESAKNCLKVLNQGEILAMMPEARLSTVGRFEDIQENTYSFLKKSQVPIYTVKLHGDYFADPKWGKGVRRGALVEAELDLLYTAQQVKELSVEEIKKGVEERLYYDEFRWLETRPNVKYRSRRLAEGLENILTICPVCGKKHTITTKKMDIFCENCGKLTSLNQRYGFVPGFRFQNFAQWYDWQKEQVKSLILQDPEFTLTSPVELRLPGEGNSLTRSAGRGVCTLDRKGLRYVGTRDGAPFEASFSIERIYRLLFGAGENFEVYNGSEILYFVPDEKRSAVDWYMASMILNDSARFAE